jgi:hypothetical protein
VQVVSGTATTSTSGQLAGTAISSTATCPAGKLVLGGGYVLSGGLLALTVIPTESRATSTTTWRATAANHTLALTTFTVQAYAVCTA